jgi:hypothetical protein
LLIYKRCGVTQASVKDFIDSAGNPQISPDSWKVVALERAIKACVTLEYADRSKAPRKDKITLCPAPFDGKAELFAKLGKHKGSKACVHIRCPTEWSHANSPWAPWMRGYGNGRADVRS